MAGRVNLPIRTKVIARWTVEYCRDGGMADANDSKSFEGNLMRVRVSLPALMKKKVLVLVGPTSSGKSALAVNLARTFNGEVISADSRQVYKGLDIGTGKVTKREMKGVPHHLLDVVSPKKMFTARDFVQRAARVIDDITARGKLPIVAGGTGFYIDALVGRIPLPNVDVNQKLRKQLEKKSVDELFSMLKKRDPRRAKTIDRYNKRRLVRALEIAYALGRVPRTAATPRYDALWIGIVPPPKVLEAKIRSRLLARMRRGMVAEATRLYRGGLSLKRMESFGLEYRALAEHLRGTLSRQAMIENLNRDIRRYAKRQLTYWKRNPEIRRFKSPAVTMERVVNKWIRSGGPTRNRT